MSFNLLHRSSLVKKQETAETLTESRCFFRNAKLLLRCTLALNYGTALANHANTPRGTYDVKMTLQPAIAFVCGI